MSIVLHRWGNSVGLRIAKPMLAQLGLREGSNVDIRLEAGRLVIEPARPKRLTMAELLEGFTPEDKPGELDWGKPAGNEAW